LITRNRSNTTTNPINPNEGLPP